MSETVKVLLVEDDPLLNRNIRDALVQEGIALMGSMGLLPAALSTGMGSEIQKPLAIMIVGGLLICMLLSLTVLPQVFYYANRKGGQPGQRGR